ncbi:MAG: hypothetical protein JSV03_09580 [Planctomycetota bacterium]|nr:MAG: hypothetical protein JSV03_09580 [Planctomycetota bacterium]
MSYFLTLAITVLSLVWTVPQPSTVPTSSQVTSLSVLDFGAKADGMTDDTGAIQGAIDRAGKTGGVVVLPSGRYLVAGRLNIAEGVALAGVNQAPQSILAPKGTVILATGGRDQENAPPLFHLGHASAVTGLTVWYPEQKPSAIVPYPWTFQLEGMDNTLENITLINSYNGIRVGPKHNVRHRIRSIYGCVLRRGIFVDFCVDIGRIENCQFHVHWWSQPSTNGNWALVYKYMIENLEAFIFGRTDWEYITNNFVFPAKIGWRFIQTEKGAANGHLTGCGADACETAIQIDAIQPMGLLITGGEFVSFTGKDPVQVRISNTCNGSARFVNCAFWGPALHNAIIQGRGFASFSDCYFSNWNKDAGNKSLVVCESGRLQINNSTFATSQPSVLLGPNVKHAIIQGNNGIAGVRIIDRTGGKLIAANNEPSTQPG